MDRRTLNWAPRQEISFVQLFALAQEQVFLLDLRIETLLSPGLRILRILLAPTFSLLLLLRPHRRVMGMTSQRTCGRISKGVSIPMMTDTREVVVITVVPGLVTELGRETSDQDGVGKSGNNGVGTNEGMIHRRHEVSAVRMTGMLLVRLLLLSLRRRLLFRLRVIRHKRELPLLHLLLLPVLTFSLLRRSKLRLDKWMILRLRSSILRLS